MFENTGSRTQQLWTRLTEEESEQLSQMAEKKGLLKSEFVRALLRRAWWEFQEDKGK